MFNFSGAKQEEKIPNLRKEGDAGYATGHANKLIKVKKAESSKKPKVETCTVACQTDISACVPKLEGKLQVQAELLVQYNATEEIDDQMADAFEDIGEDLADIVKDLHFDMPEINSDDDWEIAK